MLFPIFSASALTSVCFCVFCLSCSFPDVLGLGTPRLDDLITALMAEGRAGNLLPRVHIALLRLLQADMEEAHAAGAAQVRCLADRVFACNVAY